MSLILLNDRFLHPLIYFIADKPTKTNLSPKIPLVGTKSYRTLLNWCGTMDIDVSRVRMFNQSDKPFSNPLSGQSLNKAVEASHIRVIALGNEAMDYLMDIGLDEFYLLPHPSPKNRLLNDPMFVKNKLEQCRDYVYKSSKETCPQK